MRFPTLAKFIENYEWSKPEAGADVPADSAATATMDKQNAEAVQKMRDPEAPSGPVSAGNDDSATTSVMNMSYARYFAGLAPAPAFDGEPRTGGQAEVDAKNKSAKAGADPTGVLMSMMQLPPIAESTQPAFSVVNSSGKRVGLSATKMAIIESVITEKFVPFSVPDDREGLKAGKTYTIVRQVGDQFTIACPGDDTTLTVSGNALRGIPGLPR